MGMMEQIARGEIDASDAVEFANEDWAQEDIPERPEGSFRGWCHDVCYHKHFPSFILYVIMLNVIVMAVGALWFDTGTGAKVIESIDHVFTLIFIFEAVVKLGGMGPGLY